VCVEPGVKELTVLNPLLSEEDAASVLEETALVLLLSSRLAQTGRCQALLQKLLASVDHTTSAALPAEKERAWEQAQLLATEVAHVASFSRHYMQANGPAAFTFDPRFLVFEYTHNLILRKEQVRRVSSWLGLSLCGCWNTVLGWLGEESERWCGFQLYDQTKLTTRHRNTLSKCRTHCLTS
jgi:hypothetical protein